MASSTVANRRAWSSRLAAVSKDFVGYMWPLYSLIRYPFSLPGEMSHLGSRPALLPAWEKSLKAYTSSSRLLFQRYRTPLVWREGSSSWAMALVRV